jgi:hypothetical protein
VEPTEALESIETALRLAIRHVMGDQWLQATGAPTEQALQQRRSNDNNRRDGVVVSDDLLSYAYTSELTSLIEANWTRFEPVFADRGRTAGYFRVVNDIRNAIAHARELVPFERDLISGIAGHLRNQVSLYRSTQANPSARYYPLIESLTDSFGRAAINGHLRTTMARLDVGQVLTFTGRAFNATGRLVQWIMYTLRGGPILSSDSSIAAFDEMMSMDVEMLPEYEDLSPEEKQQIVQNKINEANPVLAEGDSVTFEYAVTEADVGEIFGIVVHITVANARYHRYGDVSFGTEPYDDHRALRYAVNPPPED